MILMLLRFIVQADLPREVERLALNLSTWIDLMVTLWGDHTLNFNPPNTNMSFHVSLKASQIYSDLRIYNKLEYRCFQYFSTIN
ncbi:MAG: hypothetical protein K0Q95_144 [Bacteroidota bacterium]|jgi:hypothetical protein|nr:hypothetical protein [Bacteroidota bacterium]